MSPPSLLNASLIEQLQNCNKLIAGFSGGLDSTVLVHALASEPQLRAKLLAVHINHGISKNAVIWQEHCAAFCQKLSISFHGETVDFDRSANIEERARIARYNVFKSLLTKADDYLLLGHHLDDQAETLLLQLFRGAGVDGLAAMAETGNLGISRIIRPFLRHSRAQLEQYARLHQLEWIEDESNQDVHYARNYLRQQIIPLLAQKWPGVIGNIARTARHCQDARANLDALVSMDFDGVLDQRSLAIEPLRHLSASRISNVLRVWLKNNGQKVPGTVLLNRIVHEVIAARDDAVPQVSWGATVIRRYQNYLYIDQKNNLDVPKSIKWTDFPASLCIQEVGFELIAEHAEQGLMVPDGAMIDIRFRQGGESFFWHGQHKSLKKLFQEWNIPPWQRARIPLLYVNGQLAAVAGYAISDSFLKRNPKAWSIRCSLDTAQR